MIFQHTIDKVLSGEKTQTRRIVKPAERSNEWHLDGPEDMRINEVLVNRAKPDIFGMTIARQVYGLGKTYAVQPGRGQKSVARILITGLRCEDVREISGSDVKAEGFDSWGEYLETWTQMHDAPAFGYLNCDMGYGDFRSSELGIPIYAYEAWAKYLATRPAERYQAWVIEFKLVTP